MSTDESPLMPLPLPLRRTYEERGPVADLAAAAALIQAQIIDLERDYAPRNREFWQATLDMLPVVRQALQPFLRLLSDGESILSLSMIQIDVRYTLMVPVYMLDEQIDKVGIAITAHLPRCKSYAEYRLKERHDLLNKLRKLVETIQKLIDIVRQGVQA